MLSSIQTVNQVLDLLPNEVRVSKRTGWKYNENYEEVPNSIKVVEKQTEDGYTYSNEFYADGVRPVGHMVARDILKRAFKACEIGDINVDELTS